MPPATTDQSRRALLTGVACYTLWGLFPLYWPLLKPAGALEILGCRVLFSLLFVAVVLLVLRRPWDSLWRQVVVRWRPLLAASVLIAVNWLTYIWAVNAGHVVEASLGYFINPLVNIGLGMVVFRERLSRQGVIGCALAAMGVTVVAAGNWRTVWIALALAFSFGGYGVVKKTAPLGALEGLLVESAVLAPLSLGWELHLAAAGHAHLGSSLRATLLLVLAGVLTAVPLWLFASAAPHIPLGTLGVLQYIAPTLQFLMGLFVFGQHVSTGYWLGLVLVWAGSLVYLWWAVGTTRRPGRS